MFHRPQTAQAQKAAAQRTIDSTVIAEEPGAARFRDRRPTGFMRVACLLPCKSCHCQPTPVAHVYASAFAPLRHAVSMHSVKQTATFLAYDMTGVFCCSPDRSQRPVPCCGSSRPWWHVIAVHAICACQQPDALCFAAGEEEDGADRDALDSAAGGGRSDTASDAYRDRLTLANMAAAACDKALLTGPLESEQPAGGGRFPAFQMLRGPITATRRPALEAMNPAQRQIEQKQGQRTSETQQRDPAAGDAAGRLAQHGLLPAPDSATLQRSALQAVCVPF